MSRHRNIRNLDEDDYYDDYYDEDYDEDEYFLEQQREKERKRKEDAAKKAKQNQLKQQQQQKQQAKPSIVKKKPVAGSAAGGISISSGNNIKGTTKKNVSISVAAKPPPPGLSVEPAKKRSTNNEAQHNSSTIANSSNSDKTSSSISNSTQAAATPIPQIDRCVEWTEESNGANFTWYGLRIQLPDDASTRSGFHFPDAMRATEELGLVLPYNNTPPNTILEYNISTQESQPTIKINFNDQPFWNTYIFDFVNQQGSIVSDGSDYQEFNRTMNGAIRCYGVNHGGSRTYLAPVIPTLTISLQRFDEGGGTAPSPSPTPPSAAVLPYGTLPGLGLAVITVVGALVFL